MLYISSVASSCSDEFVIAESQETNLGNVRRRSSWLTDSVLVLIDTSGSGSSRHETFSNNSFYNKTEAVLLMEQLKSLTGWY